MIVILGHEDPWLMYLGASGIFPNVLFRREDSRSPLYFGAAFDKHIIRPWRLVSPEERIKWMHNPGRSVKSTLDYLLEVLQYDFSSS